LGLPPINNYATQSRARVKGRKNTPASEFRPILERAKSALERSGSTSLKANLNGVVVELTTNSRHQGDFWAHNWWRAKDGDTPQAQIYSANGVDGLEPSAYYCPESPHGKICGDDWAYVQFPSRIQPKASSALVARQPERALYMRSESQKEQDWLRRVFDRSMNENVTTRKEDCEYTKGDHECSLTGRQCVFDDGSLCCYYSFGNSRVLVRREDILGPEKVVDQIPVNLVVLLRRDDRSPAEVTLTPREAIGILQKGEYMVLPGAGTKEQWGTTSFEPWYNPYLLELNDERQASFFRSMFEDWKVPCVILNTGVEGIQQSHERIISALESSPVTESIL
jgi:hypothetical protein